MNEKSGKTTVNSRFVELGISKIQYSKIIWIISDYFEIITGNILEHFGFSWDHFLNVKVKSEK
jgi:hypothetical protein